jgi:GNAT superfamily N-acetyltransferase
MLDDALERYPVTRRLEDDIECVVRPLNADDEKGFLSFLRVVPEIERLFIKPRLGGEDFVRQWFRDLDYDHALPLIAVAHGHIIGSATLQQRDGGWKRHIGRVHSLTHPEYRDVGVSGMLIEEIIHIARHVGLTRLEAEFNGERESARQCFKHAGFQEMLRMKGYLKDMKGGGHDWVLLGMQLRTDPEFTGAGD